MATYVRVTRHLVAVAACLALLACARPAPAAVTARYVRVENPTGCVMEWQEIEVFAAAAGANVVLKHPEMFSGTVIADHNVKTREGAVIGARAVVTKDIPASAIAVGIPAKVIRYR